MQIQNMWLDDRPLHHQTALTSFQIHFLCLIEKPTNKKACHLILTKMKIGN